MDQSLVDLERCSFLRSPDPSAEPAGSEAKGLCCWADAQQRAIGTEEQRRRCLTVLHVNCPALVGKLGPLRGDSWTTNGRAARIVAEACHLAEARLEVRAEQLGPALARIFGGEP